MKKNPGALLLLAALLNPNSAWTKTTPEAESARLSQLLRPIPDHLWQEVAGQKMSEIYEITQGDTLSDISKRLFGDAKYWPKIWAINNSSITNPHWIHPKNKVIFSPGSGTTLPSLALDSQGGLTQSPNFNGEKPLVTSQSSSRSQEWKNLPRQRWETVDALLPPEVDPKGFDKRSRITFKTSSGFELEAMGVTEKLEPLARITGARNGNAFQTMGDLLFIERDDTDLEIGQTYAISREPASLSHSEAEVSGYAHPILGKVKIVAQDTGADVYVGEIISGQFMIARGDFLIPLPEKIGVLNPVVGHEPIQATVMINDDDFGTLRTLQRLVFLDRGTEDQIQPGMVFRVFEYKDAAADKEVLESNLITVADLQVVHVTERISTAVILRSTAPVERGMKATLLTRVEDINNLKPMSAPNPVEGKTELDELDQLDGNDQLSPVEERDLQQMEEWQENPPEGELAPVEEEIPPPEEGELPPPDEGELPPPEGEELPAPEEGDLPPEDEMPLEGDSSPVEWDTNNMPDPAAAEPPPTAEPPLEGSPAPEDDPLTFPAQEPEAPEPPPVP